MKILVINSGSSSIKFQLFAMPEEKVLAKGLIEKIGEETSFVTYKSEQGQIEAKEKIIDHEKGVMIILSLLTDSQKGAVSSPEEIKGIGHRVVHGGEEFTSSVIISDEVIAQIKKFSELAPLHNPPNLMGIMACKKFLPYATQVAVFDTAFHQSLSPQAYLYAIPFDFYKKYKIRKYGFHGTSHLYVCRRASLLLNKPQANLISCHLGNGCSITAVEKGRSVDTSMGLTPLEGLVMGTRSGDIDPAIIFYLADKGYSIDEINAILNKRSGLLGISGVSNDMRNLVEASRKGEERARIAIEIFCYRIKKYIGAYFAVLGEVDALIFTGGIGQNNAFIRELCLKGLKQLGIILDETKNNTALPTQECLISADNSLVKIFVIPTNEELQIAQDTYRLAQQ
ncbi:MAG: acetate kinase [Candidatus Omnitrophica bacterium]|nr:acetate kinase [Candidatus Omnitrophota bacterium]